MARMVFQLLAKHLSRHLSNSSSKMTSLALVGIGVVLMGVNSEIAETNY